MKKISSYEINVSTLLLIPYKNKYTKVIELNNEYISTQKPIDIIKSSCEFYGCSYLGRTAGTKCLLNISSKLPIFIEERVPILFFPTSSPRNSDCIWVSYNNLLKYEKKEDNVNLYFNKKDIITLNLSYYILDNQITRCIKLITEFEKRRKNLNY